MKDKFAQQLTAARALRGMSQARLAHVAGIHATQISHYESAKRQPSIGNLCLLSIALRVSTDALIGLESLPEPEPCPITPSAKVIAEMTREGGDGAVCARWIAYVLVDGWDPTGVES